MSVNKKATRSVTVSRLVNRSGSWLRMRSSRPLQLRGGIHPQLVAQILPGALVGAQRLGLAAVPVEGHHQLRLEPLPQRILRRQATNSPATTWWRPRARSASIRASTAEKRSSSRRRISAWRPSTPIRSA